MLFVVGLIVFLLEIWMIAENLPDHEEGFMAEKMMRMELLTAPSIFALAYKNEEAPGSLLVAGGVLFGV